MRRSGLLLFAGFLAVVFAASATAGAPEALDDTSLAVSRGVELDRSRIIQMEIRRESPPKGLCEGASENVFHPGDSICFEVTYFQAVAGKSTIAVIITNHLGRMTTLMTTTKGSGAMGVTTYARSLGSLGPGDYKILAVFFGPSGISMTPFPTPFSVLATD